MFEVFKKGFHKCKQVLNMEFNQSSSLKESITQMWTSIENGVNQYWSVSLVFKLISIYEFLFEVK